jgi:hypothetical protein
MREAGGLRGDPPTGLPGLTGFAADAVASAEVGEAAHLANPHEPCANQMVDSHGDPPTLAPALAWHAAHTMPQTERTFAAKAGVTGAVSPPRLCAGKPAHRPSGESSAGRGIIPATTGGAICVLLKRRSVRARPAPCRTSLRNAPGWPTRFLFHQEGELCPQVIHRAPAIVGLRGDCRSRSSPAQLRQGEKRDGSLAFPDRSSRAVDETNGRGHACPLPGSPIQFAERYSPNHSPPASSRSAL